MTHNSKSRKINPIKEQPSQNWEDPDAYYQEAVSLIQENHQTGTPRHGAAYYEKAMTLILRNPQLSKSALRMFLMLVMGPHGKEHKFRNPDVMELLGIEDAGTARQSAEALVKAGLAVIPRNGSIAIINPLPD